MNEAEKLIKQKRLVQATQNNLMGLNGKLGCIAKFMGDPITMHLEGGQFFSSTELDDPYYYQTDINDCRTAEEIANKIPMMNADQDDPQGPEWREFQNRINVTTYDMGWIFDGLNKGLHLEIKYMVENNELIVYYKGSLVYKESAGDLDAYVPHPEWEDKVDQLFKTAEKIREKNTKSQREENIDLNKRQKESWLQSIKKKWGY